MIGALGGGEDVGAPHAHVVTYGQDSGLPMEVVDRCGAGAAGCYSESGVLRDLEVIYVAVCSAWLPGGVGIS